MFSPSLLFISPDSVVKASDGRKRRRQQEGSDEDEYHEPEGVQPFDPPPRPASKRRRPVDPPIDRALEPGGGAGHDRSRRRRASAPSLFIAELDRFRQKLTHPDVNVKDVKRQLLQLVSAGAYETSDAKINKLRELIRPAQDANNCY
jgi:hypothetical protein